jgi:hypothetical protein
MKHLKGQITISRPTWGDGRKTIQITVKDCGSRVSFLTVDISYEDFAECLTGMSNVTCSLETRGLHNVGKVRETEPLTFKMPSKYGGKKEARQEVVKHTPEGWTADNYFGSQDSFFYVEDQQWARTSISRWVEDESNE